MATYQISFFALDPAGAPDLRAAPLCAGESLVLADAGAGVVLVEHAAEGPIVAQGSPHGIAGQTVAQGCRITATTSEAVSRTLRYDVLELGGVPAGLIGPDPGTAGVALRVTGVTAPGDARLVPDLGTAGLSGNATGKPRKTLFAFTPGTRIDTADGARPVEALAPGDLVSTLDNGSQRLRWCGQRHVTLAEMSVREDLRPIRLESGAFGNPAPLLVSPRHRILLNDWRAQVYFGEDQVLVPAQALINGKTVRQILPISGVTYVHLLFDRHEVIVAEGVLSESFHPGESGLGSLDPGHRQEIEAMFPDNAMERRRAAFPMLRMAEARALRLPG